MTESKVGWAIAIKRSTDGTEFFASSGNGILPAVFPKNKRKHAVEHKRDLIMHGFKCRIVPVEYFDPIEIVDAPPEIADAPPVSMRKCLRCLSGRRYGLGGLVCVEKKAFVSGEWHCEKFKERKPERSKGTPSSASTKTAK